MYLPEGTLCTVMRLPMQRAQSWWGVERLAGMHETSAPPPKSRRREHVDLASGHQRTLRALQSLRKALTNHRSHHKGMCRLP